MFEAHLATTTAEGLRPLGTAPQRSFELIHATVATRLGDAHAALFAEPVSTKFGDSYDWYATVPGTAAKLTSLSEAEQADLRATLGQLSGDIAELAQAYLESDNGDDQRLGEALQNALEVPGEDFIHVLTRADGSMQPVLVNWAWIADQQAAPRGVLRGMDTRQPPKPAAARPPAQDPLPASPVLAAAAVSGTSAAPAVGHAASFWWLWLGWLLLALMIAAILLLLIAPCALRLPGLTSFCPQLDARATVLQAETAQLEQRIALTERRIALADQACQPPRVAEIPVPATADAGAPEIDARLQERGAQRGELTISLAWDSRADLDLHVTCPAGLRLWYGAREGCGGMLDIDDNRNAQVARTDPIESTFFTAPAPGSYAIRVEYFTGHGASGPQAFRLRIQSGTEVTTLSGSVGPTDKVWTTDYTYGGN